LRRDTLGCSVEPEADKSERDPDAGGVTLTCVLVVEDDPWIQWIIADELADRGNEVLTARDGVEALERLRQSRPDVMILDLRLPRLDGWELARRYRSLTGGEVVPIVVVSGARAPDPPEAALGVRRYLRKPFDMEELVLAVAQCSGHQPERAAVVGA
jgi:chemosensory pili system protein ChpA (sensor histidine kinase/response regulator)